MKDTWKIKCFDIHVDLYQSDINNYQSEENECT